MKAYIQSEIETELFFFNEMICSLELTGSNISKKDNLKKNLTVNKTEISNEKRISSANKNKKGAERINDPERQKPCPTGCGARFCKLFYELPADERFEVSKKKKLCGKCLCGCYKYGHKGPSDCTMNITCKKGGSPLHNTLTLSGPGYSDFTFGPTILKPTFMPNK